MTANVKEKKQLTQGEIHRKHVMMQRGFSVSSLANRLNVSPAFISMLIAGKRRSDRIEKQISRIMGISRNSLWE